MKKHFSEAIFRVVLGPGHRCSFAKGVRSYLQFDITDFSGQTRTMRLYYDGHSPPWLGLLVGTKYSPISFLAYDGIRLRLAYERSTTTTTVATIYLKDPSVDYNLGPMTRGALGFEVNDASQIYSINEVGLVGSTPQEMFASSSKYPHGRLGPR